MYAKWIEQYSMKIARIPLALICNESIRNVQWKSHGCLYHWFACSTLLITAESLSEGLVSLFPRDSNRVFAVMTSLEYLSRVHLAASHETERWTVTDQLIISVVLAQLFFAPCDTDFLYFLSGTSKRSHS